MLAVVPAAWLLTLGLAADTTPDPRATSGRPPDCGAAFTAAMATVPGAHPDTVASAVRAAALDAAGAARVRVEGAYGAVRVEGRPGLRAVRATAAVCTNVARFLPGLQLAAERRGGDVVVTARRPSGGEVAMAPVGFWMMLVVEVPAALPVEVETVGDLEVRGVAGLRAELCAARVLGRWLRYARPYAGRTRPDMAPGCPEQMTWEFLRWVWDYPRTRRPGVLRRLAALPPDRCVAVLRSRAAVARFLAGLGPDDTATG